MRVRAVGWGSGRPLFASTDVWPIAGRKGRHARAPLQALAAAAPAAAVVLPVAQRVQLGVLAAALPPGE